MNGRASTGRRRFRLRVALDPGPRRAGREPNHKRVAGETAVPLPRSHPVSFGSFRGVGVGVLPEAVHSHPLLRSCAFALAFSLGRAIVSPFPGQVGRAVRESVGRRRPARNCIP